MVNVAGSQIIFDVAFEPVSDIAINLSLMNISII